MIFITLLVVTLPSFKNHSLTYVRTLPHLPTILKEPLVSNPGCWMHFNNDNLRTYPNGALKANNSHVRISFGKTRRITLQGGLFTLCAYILYITCNLSYTYGIHPWSYEAAVECAYLDPHTHTG